MDILKKLATTIRMLSACAVEKANSGHPGLPMGAADYAAILWAYYLKFNPENPHWDGRDRFVLSAGHGSMLLYSLLHLFEYDLSIEEIENFRQWNSKTPGHPEFEHTVGVECTTGPLGQGFANGVGMAMSAKMMRARYDQELYDYNIFGIVSDGDLMEGVASEAASVAGHLKLNNLIYIYDQNNISIGGNTDITFTEDVAKRFESYGWFVQTINGHNFDEIKAALDKATAEKERPSIICARTIIGFGSPNMAGKSSVHGAPLGEKELEQTTKSLTWEYPPFVVPDDVKKFCSDRVSEKKEKYNQWQQEFKNWQEQNPKLTKDLTQQKERGIPQALKEDLIKEFSKDVNEATRILSGQALQVLAEHLPQLVGGSADLEPSNKTLITKSSDIQANDFIGKNIRFGVREHSMAAICNGLAYTREWVPFCATFLVFSDYMRPSIRVAALSKLQTLFVFTHDSFYVGEDGPTHEPIEHVMSLRLIPNLYVFRPADGIEVAMSYYKAVEMKNSPSALLFTRQKLAPLKKEKFNPEDVLKGAYVVSGKQEHDLVIIATGSEVSLACEAAEELKSNKINARVVSMPCMDLFFDQPKEYQNEIIPPNAKKVSIEAGLTMGWERIIGKNGLAIGLDHYGASAPDKVLAKQFGFTKEAVTEKILRWMEK